ncbi:hypothetical protein [Halobacterium rubrum]|uniref:hypothetical protein n=1 Tax=Halobacterium TaxID=2239 RepID=UPI001F21156B|nr:MULTISPECIES: hypothetical protein [Halobacterium]MDH5021717.1 hypothetical protein [Halobacterium rubrum]
MTDAELPDLEHKDIEFLEAVRAINADPDAYEETDPGEVAANSTSIRSATNLSRSEIKYRMGADPDDYRGFGEEGLGLLRIHSASLENGRFGPKSAELTERGVEVLDEAKSRVRFGGAPGQATEEGTAETADQMAELEAEVEALQQNIADVAESVQSVNETLSRFEDRDRGALDSEFADKLNAVLKALPRHDQALSEVLGVDLDQLGSDLDDDQKQALRAGVLDTLQTAEGASGTQADRSTSGPSGATGE